MVQTVNFSSVCFIACPDAVLGLRNLTTPDASRGMLVGFPSPLAALALDGGTLC